jgi:hypothetical protein
MILVLIIVLLVAGVCHAQTSPDGTKVPPAANISIVGAPVVWSLGKPTTLCSDGKPNCPGNFEILRNGVGVLGAHGSQIAWCKGSVFVLGRDKRYWQFTGAWQLTGLTSLPCDAPTSVAIPFNLNWTDPNEQGTVTKYRIYRDGLFIADVLYPTSAYTDTRVGVPGKTTGCYEMTPVNSIGEGPKSNRECKTK